MLNLKISDVYNDGVWLMQMGDKTYKMYSTDELQKKECNFKYNTENLFRCGRDVLAEQLLRKGEPDFEEVKNTIPQIESGAYMILGAPATWHNLTVGLETGNMYEKEISSFANAILTDSEPEITAQDGIFVQQIVENAYISSKKQCFVNM